MYTFIDTLYQTLILHASWPYIFELKIEYTIIFIPACVVSGGLLAIEHLNYYVVQNFGTPFCWEALPFWYIYIMIFYIYYVIFPKLLFGALKHPIITKRLKIFPAAPFLGVAISTAFVLLVTILGVIMSSEKKKK